MYEPIVEHGQRMSGGGYQIRWAHPLLERVAPLAEWIELEQRTGGRVYRRTIMVVDDWTEVPDGGGDGLRTEVASAFPAGAQGAARGGVPAGEARGVAGSGAVDGGAVSGSAEA